MKYPLLEKLEEKVMEGIVSKRKHPDFPLYIYNYTTKATHLYRRPYQWPSEVLEARGLILDEAGEIIARSFKKFFNYGEYLPHELPPIETARYAPKHDGSLILVFKYKDQTLFASRGSFTSDQAQWAREIYKEHPFTIVEGKTILCELIHPSNRIVCDYGDSKELRFLGSVNPENGWFKMDSESYRLNPPSMEYLITNIPSGEEGFVLQYPSGLMVKIKAEEYVRQHRLIFGLNARRAWEQYLEGKKFPKALPSIYRDWCAGVIRRCRREYQSRMNYLTSNKTMVEVMFNNKVSEEDFFKSCAEFLVHHEDKGLIMCLLRGKDIRDKIRKEVTPSGKEKPQFQSEEMNEED
jgi:RNA ligase